MNTRYSQANALLENVNLLVVFFTRLNDADY